MFIPSFDKFLRLLEELRPITINVTIDDKKYGIKGVQINTDDPNSLAEAEKLEIAYRTASKKLNVQISKLRLSNKDLNAQQYILQAIAVLVNENKTDFRFLNDLKLLYNNVKNKLFEFASSYQTAPILTQNDIFKIGPFELPIFKYSTSDQKSIKSAEPILNKIFSVFKNSSDEANLIQLYFEIYNLQQSF